jgi:hypothetical protein
LLGQLRGIAKHLPTGLQPPLAPGLHAASSPLPALAVSYALTQPSLSSFALCTWLFDFFSHVVVVLRQGRHLM